MDVKSLLVEKSSLVETFSDQGKTFACGEVARTR